MFKITASCFQCPVKAVCKASKGRAIKEVATKILIGDKQYIFQVGQPLLNLYVIRSGTAVFQTNNSLNHKKAITFKFPSDVTGFDAIAEQKHVASLQALDQVVVCALRYKPMIQKFNISSVIMTKLLAASYNIERCVLINASAKYRVAYFLLMLSKKRKKLCLDDQLFKLAMSRAQLGQSLGLTQETTSRALKELQDNKLIEARGKYIMLTDPNGLHKVVE